MLAAAACFAMAAVRAQPPEAIAQGVRSVVDSLYRLDYPGAEAACRRMIRENPDHPGGYGMLATVALNELLFAAKNLAIDDYATPNPFVGEPTDKKIDSWRAKFLQAIADLQRVCDRRLAAKPNDTVALYFRGLAFENLATEAIAVDKDNGQAIKHGKTARNLHERVLRLDPGFVDANVSLAVHEFAAATLPWSIKWLAFLLGIRGNKDKALARLSDVAEHGTYRRMDARVLLALLHSWKGDPQRAVAIFERLRGEFPQNYLSDINLAAIYALRLDQPQRALEVYRQLLRDLPRKAPGIHPGEVYYRIGKTYRQLGDFNHAAQAFQAALEHPCGEAETKALSHFQLAEIHRLKGETSQARRHYQAVLDYRGPDTNMRDELETARRQLRRQ